MCLVGWGGRKVNGRLGIFSPGPQKSFLSKKEKTEGRNWASFLDENVHVQLHMGFIHIAFLHTFFSFIFSSWRCLPLFFFLFFFFFLFLIYWVGLARLFFFFLFLLILPSIYIFFYGHDFLKINLRDYFFLVVITFLVLIRHHFLIRVYV